MRDNMIHSRIDQLENGIKGLPKRASQSLTARGYTATAQMVNKVDIDAPLTISFIVICFALHILKCILGESLVYNFFAVPSMSIFSVTSPRCWFTTITQVLGHSSWEHLFGNVSLLLLTGPTNERAFGMYVLLKIILVTAATSSMAHILFGATNSVQLGASGVVFMQILLSSLIEVQRGRVPLTFLLQVALWCYKELALLLLGSSDGVSHLAHISGALCGVAAGYAHVDSAVISSKKMS